MTWKKQHSAGVQFSKTLIDFAHPRGVHAHRWGSVLKNLIDFPASPLMVSVGWGSVLKNLIDFASQETWNGSRWGSVLKNPDRLQVAKKSCLTWFFGLPEV
ncbi:hypothetical protein ACQX4M_04270 [Corynebacterium diphtheriae]